MCCCAKNVFPEFFRHFLVKNAVSSLLSERYSVSAERGGFYFVSRKNAYLLIISLLCVRFYALLGFSWRVYGAGK